MARLLEAFLTNGWLQSLAVTFLFALGLVAWVFIPTWKFRLEMRKAERELETNVAMLKSMVKKKKEKLDDENQTEVHGRGEAHLGASNGGRSDGEQRGQATELRRLHAPEVEDGPAVEGSE